MDRDHDSGLDGVLEGGLDGGRSEVLEDVGSSASGLDEDDNFEAWIGEIGRTRQSQGVVAPNEGLSAENLVRFSNPQAGPSRSTELAELSSIGPEGNPP